jgi:aryl-alcohol dehydrogenase-like predicted oxidoreductase
MKCRPTRSRAHRGAGQFRAVVAAQHGRVAPLLSEAVQFVDQVVSGDVALDQAAKTFPFVAMQNQYNLLRRQDERELLPMCADMRVGAVPYSPQGKGRLARPGGEQSKRSSEDKVVQAFDSPSMSPSSTRSTGSPKPGR